MDIRFFNLELELLYILPQKSNNTGYISANATKEFCGVGSIEIVFVDNELKRIIKENRENIVVAWNGVQGFITGYTETDSKMQIFGMTLNGLLHRICLPPNGEYKNYTADRLCTELIQMAAPSWLTLSDTEGIFTKKSTYNLGTYRYADEFVAEVLSADNGGYLVYADISEKKYYFKCIKCKEVELIISKNNLNAYDIEVTYSNKEAACSGWYAKEQEEGDPVWQEIIRDGQKTGIHKVSVILSATNPAEAEMELKTKIPEYSIFAKTRNISFGKDYFLGDVVRVQSDKSTKRQLISSVDLWCEVTQNGSEPKMTELREE